MALSPLLANLSLLVLALTWGTQAHASSLGAQSDMPKSSARARVAAGADSKYTVQETEVDATTVREYISSSTGIVFGFAWSGARHPDLEPLLGSYAAEYRSKNTRSSRKAGHRHHTIQSNHLVVSKWGHPRKLGGRAYDPDLIPEGVTADEIK